MREGTESQWNDEDKCEKVRPDSLCGVGPHQAAYVKFGVHHKNRDFTRSYSLLSGALRYETTTHLTVVISPCVFQTFHIQRLAEIVLTEREIFFQRFGKLMTWSSCFSKLAV